MDIEARVAKGIREFANEMDGTPKRRRAVPIEQPLTWGRFLVFLRGEGESSR